MTPTPSQIVTALRAAGLTVVELRGWADRCRCHTGPHTAGGPQVRAFVGVLGITWHQTYGARLSGSAAEEYAHRVLSTEGNGVTPGPLCFAGIDADGRWILTGQGRCNHLGKVSKAAFRAIRDGSWSMSDNYDDRRGSDVDGNQITLGLECMSNSAPNATQRASMVTGTAVLCRLYGLSAGSVHGHGEASDKRAYDDPNLDMGQARRDVRDAITAQQKKTTRPTGGTATTKGDLIMAITKAQQDDFNTLMTGWAKSKPGREALAVAAMSATYGLDLDKNRKADSIGQLLARTVTTVERVAKKVGA